MVVSSGLILNGTKQSRRFTVGDGSRKKLQCAGKCDGRTVIQTWRCVARQEEATPCVCILRIQNESAHARESDLVRSYDLDITIMASSLPASAERSRCIPGRGQSL